MTKIFLLSLVISSNQMNDLFLTKVLNDFNNYSYFIAIDVVSESYSGRAIIQNNDLFYYFEQTDALNYEMYKDTMLMLIQENIPLINEKLDFEEWNFIKVGSEAQIDENVEKGMEQYIKIYFDGKVLKDGISDVQRAVIINQLFEWKIACNIDDETGYLVISR